MDILFNKHYYTHMNGCSYELSILPSLSFSRHERTSDCKRQYYLIICLLFWSLTLHWYKS